LIFAFPFAVPLADRVRVRVWFCESVLIEVRRDWRIMVVCKMERKREEDLSWYFSGRVFALDGGASCHLGRRRNWKNNYWTGLKEWILFKRGN
jgi:hypothetical protein